MKQTLPFKDKCLHKVNMMHRPGKYLVTVVIATLSVLLIHEAALSLGWRIGYDPPIMLYAGYLINAFHFVPYRDFFEQNMVGTYLLHALLVKVAGSDDVLYRIIDLTLLAVLLANTFLALRKANAAFALFATALSGLGFFLYGEDFSLEREFFILVLVMFMINILMYFNNLRLKMACIGFLTGLCITIKPHSGIIFPVFLFLIFFNERKKGCSHESLIQSIVLSFMCFLAPITAMFIYLWGNNALPPFYDIAAHYWKLYAHIDKNMEYRDGLDRTAYLVKEFFKFSNHSLLLIPAFYGFLFAKEAEARTAFLNLACFTAVFSLYPVFSGQFWNHHLYMFFYFVLLLSVFSLLPLFTGHHLNPSGFIIQIILMTAIVFYVAPKSYAKTKKTLAGDPKIERVDNMVRYLREQKVTRQSRIQPLDWTGGGAVHAMLITGVRPATRFLQDFHFYHDTSSQYIHQLRREFIADLHASKPEYIIQFAEETKGWINGKNTSRVFPELAEFIAVNYIADFRSDGAVIYKIKTNGATR